jgi:hypothetical protein
MNDKDKYNLQFMLALSTNQFTDWYQSISFADREYANELLDQAKQEIIMQVASMHDDIEDVTDAKKCLKQFTLKGN